MTDDPKLLAQLHELQGESFESQWARACEPLVKWPNTGQWVPWQKVPDSGAAGRMKAKLQQEGK